MRDLQTTDVLIRQDPKFSNVSVYLNGTWQFAGLSNPIKVFEGQSYYRVSYPFGLVEENTFDPRLVGPRGNAGDYVIVGSNGYLNLVSADYYSKLFPQIITSQPEQVTNSNLLRNPMFLTNVVRGIPQSNYNTTVVQTTVVSTPTETNSTNCNCS